LSMTSEDTLSSTQKFADRVRSIQTGGLERIG